MSTYRYSATGLPAGLTLDALTGEISGTPTAIGAFSASITVDSPTDSKTISWASSIIDDPMHFGADVFPDGTIGQSYLRSVPLLGYYKTPLSRAITSGALPPGMTLDSSGASLSGTPTGYGTFDFTVVTTDSTTPTARTTPPTAMTVVIDNSPITLSGTLAANAQNGAPYSSTLTLGGNPIAPVTITASAGTIPAWMSVSVTGNTVQFSGTPTATGTVSFTPQATDSATPAGRSCVGSAQSITITNPLVTWVKRTAPFAPNIAAWGGSILCAINSGSTGSAYSSDSCATWTSESGPPTDTWMTVAYGNGLFVAFSQGGTTYATSPDGITWTSRAVPNTNVGSWALYFANGRFVLFANYDQVGSAIRYAVTSTDGITWTACTLPTSFTSGNSGSIQLVFGNGVFLACGSGTTPLIKSSDGTTWTSTGASNLFSRFAFGLGSFVGIGTGNTIYTSTDGATWTARTTPAPPGGQVWKYIGFCNGVFLVVVDFGTQYLVSTDGITWTEQNFADNVFRNAIVVNSNTFFVASISDPSVQVGTT